MNQERDHSLHTLLDLDGFKYFVGGKGHRVQFDVKTTEVSPGRPHGVKYLLTIHDEKGERIGGFDNAHPVRASDGPGGRRHEYDHKHCFRTVRPYEYSDAATLLEDFWKLADDVLREEGVRL